eukprot:8144794-Pyramimonas_sp.AAC.1
MRTRQVRYARRAHLRAVVHPLSELVRVARQGGRRQVGLQHLDPSPAPRAIRRPCPRGAVTPPTSAALQPRASSPPAVRSGGVLRNVRQQDPPTRWTDRSAGTQRFRQEEAVPGLAVHDVVRHLDELRVPVLAVPEWHYHRSLRALVAHLGEHPTDTTPGRVDPVVLPIPDL